MSDVGLYVEGMLFYVMCGLKQNLYTVHPSLS